VNLEAFVDKKSFLKTVTTEHDHWFQLVAKIKPGEMVESGVCGAWSVKDIIAHITWYEHEMIPLMIQHRLIGSELWDVPTDQRNAILFEQNRNRPIKKVLEESRQVYDAFLQALINLTDDDLMDATHFQDMPADWVPWKIIAENSSEHYQQHIPGLVAWVKSKKPQGARHK
jgi:hypothetical protein